MMGWPCCCRVCRSVQLEQCANRHAGPQPRQHQHRLHAGSTHPAASARPVRARQDQARARAAATHRCRRGGLLHDLVVLAPGDDAVAGEARLRPALARGLAIVLRAAGHMRRRPGPWRAQAQGAAALRRRQHHRRAQAMTRACRRPPRHFIHAWAARLPWPCVACIVAGRRPLAVCFTVPRTARVVLPRAHAAPLHAGHLPCNPLSPMRLARRLPRQPAPRPRPRPRPRAAASAPRPRAPRLRRPASAPASRRPPRSSRLRPRTPSCGRRRRRACAPARCWPPARWPARATCPRAGFGKGQTCAGLGC